MQIKPLHDFFKSKNALIVEATENVRITVALKDKALILTHSFDGRTMICHKTDKDIRFAGEVTNLQQMKMILQMVSAIIE